MLGGLLMNKEGKVDEPYPRHWLQRLWLLRSRPDQIGGASMRGGRSGRIVGDASGPPYRGGTCATIAHRRACRRLKRKPAEAGCSSAQLQRVVSEFDAQRLDDQLLRPGFDLSGHD